MVRNRSRHASGCVKQGRARFRGEAPRRCLLDDFLILSLQGAFALAKIDDRPRPVSHNLNFEVPRVFNSGFEVKVRGTKERFGLFCAAFEGLIDITRCINRSHPSTPATRDGLHHQLGSSGKVREQRLCLGRSRDCGRPAKNRNTEIKGDLSRGQFIPEKLKLFGSRPYEFEVGLRTCGCECSTLTQKPIAGMHRITRLALRDSDKLIDVEVRRRPLALELEKRVAALRVQASFIVGGSDHHGLNLHLGGRSCDPNGDLSPIGDQQLPHASFLRSVIFSVVPENRSIDTRWASFIKREVRRHSRPQSWGARTALLLLARVQSE